MPCPCQALPVGACGPSEGLRAVDRGTSASRKRAPEPRSV